MGLLAYVSLKVKRFFFSLLAPLFISFLFFGPSGSVYPVSKRILGRLSIETLPFFFLFFVVFLDLLFTVTRFYVAFSPLQKMTEDI